MDQHRVPIPSFELWLTAAAFGILPVDRLTKWADEQIAKHAEPPYWLLALATAKDVEGIWKAMQSATLPDFPTKSRDYDKIHLGCLYLAHLSGKISLSSLLRRAGEYSDHNAGNGIPECEAFYLLLNEIDDRGPTIPSNRPLQERVAELFSPMIQTLRERFGVDESTSIEAMLPEFS